jgi:alanine racemase
LNYALPDIASIIHATASRATDIIITEISWDSRRIITPAQTLFFALPGARRNGQQFIEQLYQQGVRSFVTTETVLLAPYPDAVFLQVANTQTALQQLTAYHRSCFVLPVIGITGSNGKTIVKEWLYQLLHHQYHIVRSPRSYNSQIGVPLSVWQIQSQHNLAIFEAGISEPGEMDKLQAIIQPTIGVLTNIGEAHSAGFINQEQKLTEKLLLFRQAETIIYCSDNGMVHEAVQQLPNQSISWGHSPEADVLVVQTTASATQTHIQLLYRQQPVEFSIYFTDEAAVENAITCATVLLALGCTPVYIQENMLLLLPVNMRLELKKGINNCVLINDSYSADINSLQNALHFLSQQNSSLTKTAILSDFTQTATDDITLYGQILQALRENGVHKLIGIGAAISHALAQRSSDEGMVVSLYPSTESFIQQFRPSQFKEEAILIKGARVFGFEQIVPLLEQKAHQTVLEINLNALISNVKQYQQQLQPATKIMAMVKAFAYGSGGAEIAGILQFHKVDYLGVAYVDEGVELRKAGITLPIMVMNPEPAAFENIITYNLEPDMFSPEILQAFTAFVAQEGLQHYPVHIEIETGMNRLGFLPSQVHELARQLSTNSLLKVQSVFSHLAASEDGQEDAYTLSQFEKYNAAVSILQEQLSYPFLRHIANTSAIGRLPQLQLDMVRLGIGMYGVGNIPRLQQVATLKTTVAQVKDLAAGETVSYNRRGVLQRDSKIATVRIGYADGYSRKLGYGNGYVLVHGQPAPVVGTVCMDMTMVDVTDIADVNTGDEVIIFGKDLPIQQLSTWAGTIPYEIMTGISQRVKRVYFEE